MNDLNELMASLHAAMKPNVEASVAAVNQTCLAMAPHILAAQKAAVQIVAEFAAALPPFLREVPRG